MNYLGASPEVSIAAFYHSERVHPREESLKSKGLAKVRDPSDALGMDTEGSPRQAPGKSS